MVTRDRAVWLLWEGIWCFPLNDVNDGVGLGIGLSFLFTSGFSLLTTMDLGFHTTSPSGFLNTVSSLAYFRADVKWEASSSVDSLYKKLNIWNLALGIIRPCFLQHPKYTAPGSMGLPKHVKSHQICFGWGRSGMLWWTKGHMSRRQVQIGIFQDFKGVVSSIGIRKVAIKALNAGISARGHGVSVVIADDETLRILNRDYRGLDNVTDVLQALNVQEF
mgnify:CR=1 FL=1